MTSKPEFREVAWWEQKPDLYAGENCDEVRPRWYGYAEGDKEGGFDEEIVLLPDRFPPGTRVVVSMPLCPQCGQIQELCQPEAECGFDWVAWRDSRFS